MLRMEHQCEIPIRRKDIVLRPGRGTFRKLYDFFRIALMASHRNPSARKYLRSHASIVYEMRRHLRSEMYIIHPFSIFRHFWDFLMIFAITILLLAVPYQAAFDMEDRSYTWTILKNILLFFCCLDITFNLVTGYFDKEGCVVIMKQKDIMKRYIVYGNFFTDLLGSLPTDLIYITMWYQYTVARKITSLICVFRVFSLSSYIGSMAWAYDTPLALYEFCIIIFWLMIVLHWQTCLYWIVPIATASMHLPMRPRNDSWLHESNLWNASTSEQYLSCFLHVSATFLRSGVFRTYSDNMLNLYMIILVQILGIVNVFILVARVMKFFKGANSSRLKYRSAVAQLKQYMRHKQLPHLTQRRIVQYYQFRFQRRYFRETEILNTLSSQMRQEISMHSCRKLVENVTFFDNLPFPLLGRIVSLMRSEIFLTNDVILRVDQPGDCMYFIATGTVAIYTHSGKEVCHLKDGAHFGEIALVMPNERRVASVVAVEVCELYRLDRVDFFRTIHPYPMLWDRVKKIAVERYEKTTILDAH